MPLPDYHKNILSIVLREMRAYGDGYRTDWSDFDGRSLKAQLDNLADWAEDPNGSADYTEGSEFKQSKWE